MLNDEFNDLVSSAPVSSRSSRIDAADDDAKEARRCIPGRVNDDFKLFAGVPSSLFLRDFRRDNCAGLNDSLSSR